MKIDTPLHTDHQLDQLAGQFDALASDPLASCRTHSPTPLGSSRRLARVLPYSRVAQHLRVSPSDLKKHMATPHDSRPATAAMPPRFVEVPPTPAWSSATPAMEIELERHDGARLRLRCPDIHRA